jgi:hypothetical protein
VARQRIKLETKPHVIELEGIPDTPTEVIELEFVPEVLGEDYLEAFATYQERLRAAGFAGADPTQIDLAGMDDTRAKVQDATAATRDFLAEFMLPGTRELFETLRLPHWVLVRMMKTLVELYSDRPTGSSNGSPPASSRAGRRSTAPSPSKGSTRRAGR